MRIARNRVAVCPDVPEFDGWLTAAEVTDLARSLVAPAAGSAAVATALAAAGLAGWLAGGSADSPAAWSSDSGWPVPWSASPSC